MKRLYTRQAKSVLTLSLLSSLMLLAACGGGKGGDAPAAPAAVASGPKEPTLLEAADPNEPYLAQATDFSKSFDGTKYKQEGATLKIIDGILQKVIAQFDLGTKQEYGKNWIHLMEAIPTSGGNTTASTMAHILASDSNFKWIESRVAFIQGGKLFQYNLRRNAAVSGAQQISDMTNACAIKDTYPLAPGDSKTAIMVSLPGTDGLCDTSDDTVVTVSTAMDATGTPAQVIDRPFTILSPMFSLKGELKGILVQLNKDKLATTSAQLAVLSNDLASIKTEKIQLPLNEGQDVSEFPTIAGNEKTQANWVVSGNNLNTSGYVRIRHTLNKAPVLFKLTLNDTGDVEAKLVDLALQDVASHLGVRDQTDTFIVNGSMVVRLDSTDPDGLNFELFEGANLPKDSTTRLISLDQTPKHLIVGLQKDKEISYKAINKSNAGFHPVASGTEEGKFRLLGVKGEVVYLTQKANSSKLGAVDVIRSDMDKAEKETMGLAIHLTDLIIASRLMSNADSAFGPQLDGFVACDAAQNNQDDCNGKVLKLHKTESDTTPMEIGTITQTNALKLEIKGGGWTGYSNILNVYKEKPNLDKSFDVWVFHPGAPRTLKEPTPLAAQVAQ